MGKDRFQVIKTTGDRGVDEETRRILGRVSTLEAGIGSAGAAGPQGPAGPTGPAGATGPTGLFVAQIVTSDPVAPAAGDVWFRSDTGYLNIFDGTYVWKVLLAH